MTYRAGAYEPAPPGTRMKTIVRPNDPADALSGTVAGFEYIDPMRTNKSVENFPQPRPSPPPPASFEDEEVNQHTDEIIDLKEKIGTIQ